MNDISECYRILDLEPGATPEEIKRSYRELVKVWHPDRFRGDARLQAKAEEKLKRINYAYERLCAEVRAKAPEPSPPKPHASRGPTASFPHPPKPQPRQANSASGPTPAEPPRPTAGVGNSGNFAHLARQVGLAAHRIAIRFDAFSQAQQVLIIIGFAACLLFIVFQLGSKYNKHITLIKATDVKVASAIGSQEFSGALPSSQ